ncbi:MAG TPA: ABC transporter permease, partial [Thermoanaerobaculia bacterium]|nr:ABC transporter permease [Thermoanaerobaculia bacterium]
MRRHAEEAGLDLPESIVEELASHLEDLHAAARAAGASAAEAEEQAAAALAAASLASLSRRAARHPDRRRARQAELHARIHRQRRSTVSTALTTAVRQLRRQPRFVLVTALVLGLGTAAATTVFTIVDSVVLRPLPYPAPDRLVALWDTHVEQGLPREPISPVNFMDPRAVPVYEDAAAWWRPAVNLRDPGLEPVRVATIETSGNLFAVLGVSPQLGPGFPADGPLHARDQEIAVISDRLWRTRYGADPGLVGRTLELDGETFELVGVMPPGFHFPDDIDVWQRLDWDMAGHSRHAHFMEGIARLAPGVTLAEAQAASDALAGRLGREHPDSNRGWGVRLAPLLDDQLGYYRPALVVLFGAVGLLLLIGVLNVASLLVTRALAREREMAIRVAIGAARRHLLAQLMAESLVLSLLGAGLGVALAGVALPLVVRFAPVDLPRLAEASLDWRALGVALAVTAVTTLVFGLVPALLLLRRRVASELKSGERGSSRGARRVYGSLIAVELALACALLISCALLVRTVERMTTTPTGVDADAVVTAPLQLTRGPAEGEPRLWEAWRRVGQTHAQVLERLREQPGVIAAGSANFLPLEEGWRNPFGLEGQPIPDNPDEGPQAQMHSISEGYLEAMGARLAAGRPFTAADGPDAPPVVLVNETFARRFLAAGGGATVGRRIRTWTTMVGPLGANLKRQGTDRHEGVLATVVGVVGDVRNVPLGQEVEPAIFFSARQFPFSQLVLAVRASAPATAVAALRTAVHDVVPTVPPGEVRTWGERFADVTAEPRLLRTTLAVFAGLAGLLAAIGVYGMIAWSVALRTRELAIRLALGARPAAIGWLVLGRAVALVCVGLALGLALVRLASSVLERVLFAVSPEDLAANGLAVLALIAAALAACLPP